MKHMQYATNYDRRFCIGRHACAYCILSYVRLHFQLSVVTVISRRVSSQALVFSLGPRVPLRRYREIVYGIWCTVYAFRWKPDTIMISHHTSMRFQHAVFGPLFSPQVSRVVHTLPDTALEHLPVISSGAKMYRRRMLSGGQCECHAPYNLLIGMCGNHSSVFRFRYEANAFSLDFHTHALLSATMSIKYGSPWFFDLSSRRSFFFFLPH